MALPLQHAEHTAHTGGAAGCAVLQLDVGLAHTQCGTQVNVLSKQLNLAVDGAAGQRDNLAIKRYTVRRHNFQRESCHIPTALLLLGLGQNIVNRTGKQEAAFGDAVTFAVQNHLEAAQGLLQRHILAGHTGKLLCHVEGL